MVFGAVPIGSRQTNIPALLLRHSKKKCLHGTFFKNLETDVVPVAKGMNSLSLWH